MLVKITCNETAAGAEHFRGLFKEGGRNGFLFPRFYTEDDQSGRVVACSGRVACRTGVVATVGRRDRFDLEHVGTRTHFCRRDSHHRRVGLAVKDPVDIHR